MKFSDLLKSIWENLTAEKSYFIKVMAINASICLMYLFIPAAIKTFMGVIFASAGESVVGMFEFVKEKAATIENMIAVIIAFILIIGCLVTLLTTLHTLERERKMYRLQQSFGMTPVALVAQTLVQNIAVCIVWNVVALIMTGLIVLAVSAILEVKISITFSYFLILIVAEVLITTIASLVNYLLFLDNSKSNSIKSN